MSKNAWVTISIVVLVVVVGIALTGFFVVQPIGALPDGITLWYFRAGTGLSFFESPDGLSLERTGSVSLMNRMTAFSMVIDRIESRIIARLPYQEWIYLRTTDGARFDR